MGSSTGGFTDCLLQHGARRVYAVDVTINQLDWKLQKEPRVVTIERNARYLKPDDVGELVDLVTMDVSFISVTKVLPAIGADHKTRRPIFWFLSSRNSSLKSSRLARAESCATPPYKKQRSRT